MLNQNVKQYGRVKYAFFSHVIHLYIYSFIFMYLFIKHDFVDIWETTLNTQLACHHLKVETISVMTSSFSFAHLADIEQR